MSPRTVTVPAFWADGTGVTAVLDGKGRVDPLASFLSNTHLALVAHNVVERFLANHEKTTEDEKIVHMQRMAEQARIRADNLNQAPLSAEQMSQEWYLKWRRDRIAESERRERWRKGEDHETET